MLPDQTLSGDEATVTVGDRVGAGTHWETFRGKTADGEMVAVRTLCGHVPDREYDRFESLATQWQTLSGRDAVRTLADWGTDPEPWVAVAYAPGELERLASGDSIDAAVECDPATCADLLGDVCSAIRTYGRYGSTRYHLAVGPEAVTFRTDDDGPQAVVGDWGISRLVTDPPVTPYTAPEQLGDSEHAGQRTDVYRLGALGYHLFGGAPPFAVADGRSTDERIEAGFTENDLQGIADDLRRPLGQALSAVPGRRHEGVYQFRQDVADAAPRIAPADRSTAALSLLDDDTDDEAATDSEEADAEPTDEESGADSPGQTDDSDPKEAGSEEATGVGIRLLKYTTAGVILLILLVGAAWGAMALGFVGGDAPGDTAGATSTGTVAGTVFSDPVGQEPAAGVKVTLEPTGAADGSEDQTEDDPVTATTNENGAFRFENVSGDYAVSFVADNGLRYDEMESVSAGDANLSITPTAWVVSGQVVANGRVIDADVTLLDGNQTVETTTGGQYEFEGTDFEGDYRLRVTANGYETVDRSIDAFGRQATVSLDRSTFWLGGNVTDSSGEPVEGASVTITSSDSREFSATTGPDGTYEVADVPAGEYTVSVSADGYVSTEETISIDESDAFVRFSLTESASTEGIGRDNDGNSQRFEITLTQDGETVRETNSDSDTGEYLIEGLEPGEYTLTAGRAGETDSVTFTVAAGERAVINFEVDSASGAVTVTQVE